MNQQELRDLTESYYNEVYSEETECYPTRKLHKNYKSHKKQNESYDLYDVVLDHLLAEGYADDARSAEVIMSHMSDEWLGGILDEAMKEGPRKERLAQKRFNTRNVHHSERQKYDRDRMNAFNIAVRGDSVSDDPKHWRKLGGKGRRGIRTGDVMQDRGSGNRALRRMGKEPNRVYGPLQPWQGRR